MDARDRKLALRMIPYGVYVLSAGVAGEDGEIVAATVHWVTQTSFEPPLVAVGVVPGSAVDRMASETGKFALNVLGRGHRDVAYTFQMPAVVRDGLISGYKFDRAEEGPALLHDALAILICELREVVTTGDHHLLIGELVLPRMRLYPEMRPDALAMEMRVFGEREFYAG